MDEKMEAVRDAVQIEPLAMQEEFVRIPADLSHWNAKYTEALKAFLLAKARAEEIWARVWLTTREALLADGKATEKLIEAKAQGDEDYQKAHLALIEAEVEKARVMGVVDAIRAKKEMLISLGATIRAEMEGDPLLKREMRDSRR